MNKIAFLRTLRDGLSGLPKESRNEILSDYEAYFDEASTSGRSDEDVAAALGDPARLAQELRVETGLRNWETRRNPTNFLVAAAALGGLITADILGLLPLLIVATLAALIIGIVIVLAGVLGLALLYSALPWVHFESLPTALVRVLTGAGFLAGSVGVGALLLLVLSWAMRLLGNYARLHYRLLKQTPNSMGPQVNLA